MSSDRSFPSVDRTLDYHFIIGLGIEIIYDNIYNRIREIIGAFSFKFNIRR